MSAQEDGKGPEHHSLASTSGKFCHDQRHFGCSDLVGLLLDLVGLLIDLVGLLLDLEVLVLLLHDLSRPCIVDERRTEMFTLRCWSGH